MDQLRGLAMSSNGRDLIPGTREYERQLRILVESTTAEELQPSNAHRRQKGLLDLIGKLERDASFDHKAERSRLSPKRGEGR